MVKLKPPYLSPIGTFYTKQLFWDQWITMPEDMRKIEPVFTLFRNKPGLINFGHKYIEYADPTGYRVAKELLGDYRHWQLLTSIKWFQAAKAVWDQELDAKLQAEAMETITDIANDAEANRAVRLAAAKYLANKEYRRDKSQNKGRPTKAQVQNEAARIAEAENEWNDDLKRIMGGKSDG